MSEAHLLLSAPPEFPASLTFSRDTVMSLKNPIAEMRVPKNKMNIKIRRYAKPR